jgi:hypothetical protein
MLDAITESRLGIWIIATAIILIDSVQLLEPGKFPYRLLRHERLAAVVAVPSYLFSIRNKNLVLTLLTFPCVLFHVSDVSAPLRTAAELHKLINGLRRLQRHFTLLSLFSWCALLLVALGAVLAVMLNQTLAILIVAAIIYPLAIAAGVLIYRRRRVFNLSRPAACLHAAELLLCPVLIVNLGKRLGSHLQPSVNTLQVIALFCNDASRLGGAVEQNLSFFGISARSTPA